MLQYNVFKLLCIMILWTRIDFGSSASSDLENQLSGTTPKNTADFHGQLEDSKTNGIEPNVRNFFPVKGKQKWMRREFPPVAEMLFFNISSVGDDEEVTLAQLHLHRRRIVKPHVSYHKRYLPSPYRVVFYQVQPSYKHKTHEDARTMKLASLPVSQTTKGGWHTLDVTAIVRELLINAQGPLELIFGVHFEAPRRLVKSYSPLVPIKHFLKTSGTQHPYKASSYLVVFSETDPYFEESEETETTPTTNNAIPTPRPELLGKRYFKERHLKHKISKGRVNGTDSEPVSSSGEETKGKALVKENKEKSSWKQKKIENEVLKDDVIRHKGKHREVKRSKAEELALRERTKLKLVPFLHANEVEEIRQTSRRLTRSSGPQRGPDDPTEKKRKLINVGKD